VEQRIGPNIQPLQGAAADPAFVPGITGPRPDEPKDAKPKDAKPKDAKPEATEPDGTESEDTEPDEDTESEEAVEETAAAEEAASEETASDEERDDDPSDDEPEEVPDGPVFEASDRRARIVADHRGVRLRLDDQEAEFRWDEIGAVETESPRFGKRFTITVHTPDRRWYPIEIEATAKSRFKEWESRLDEVLDAYFEDGEDSAP
jgi:hypothetical protein